MADDIVTELREWGGDGDGSEYDIEDAVPCSMLREAANKIEQLHQRGDNLHALAMAMPNPMDSLSWLTWRLQMDNALMGWEEARRG